MYLTFSSLATILPLSKFHEAALAQILRLFALLKDQRSFKFLATLENLQLADLRPIPQFAKVTEAGIRIKERKFQEPLPSIQPVRVEAPSFILDNDEGDDQHTGK